MQQFVETTTKGTGLESSAGKESPVELNFSTVLCGSLSLVVYEEVNFAKMKYLNR